MAVKNFRTLGPDLAATYDASNCEKGSSYFDPKILDLTENAARASVTLEMLRGISGSC
jgi:hypothetical protein